MSPRIANKDRGELPKPQVQNGTVGFSPLNALTLSYAYHDIGDRILSIQDDTVTSPGTFGATKQIIQVKAPGASANRKPETFELQGRFLRGLSDGLYRGKLPEVIIASPTIGQLGVWLNEISDYLEKMIRFGFFLQDDPVSRLFPNIVIVSEGIYFKRLMLALSKQLDNVPNLLPAWKDQILAKCHRGMLMDASGKPVSITAGSLCEPVALPFPPMHIRIAANHPMFSYYVSPYFSAVESILALQGFQVSLENSVPNSVERLELEYALQRASSVLIPAITRDTAQAKEADSLQTQVWNAIVSIGRMIQAFDNDTPLRTAPADIPPKAAKTKSSGKTSGEESPKTEFPKAEAPVTSDAITPNDASLFDSLRHYAESLALPNEQALFASMNQTLEKERQKTGQ